MAGLSESEELEMLELERSKALGGKAAPTFWDVAKKAAMPDIFNSGQASYDLGAKVAEKTGSPGLGYAANVGSQVVPMLLGGWAGQQASPVLKDAGRGLMQMAIKPSPTDALRGKAPRAIETMLEQGYNPTNSGINAMRQKAQDFTGQVRNITDQSNKLITTAPAVQNLNKLESKVQGAVTGVEDANEVRKVLAKLLGHPSVDKLGTMSVKDAQAMKELTSKNLGDAAYGLGLKPAVERDALKATRAGLRAGIEAAEPAVVPLNAKAGELLNAAKVAERSALRADNANPVPFGASLAASVNNPAAALGLWANSSAYAKAMLARMLYSGSEVIPRTVAQAAAVKMGAQQNPPTTEQEKRAAIAAALGKE